MEHEAKLRARAERKLAKSNELSDNDPFEEETQGFYIYNDNFFISSEVDVDTQNFQDDDTCATVTIKTIRTDNKNNYSDNESDQLNEGSEHVNLL